MESARRLLPGGALTCHGVEGSTPGRGSRLGDAEHTDGCGPSMGVAGAENRDTAPATQPPAPSEMDPGQAGVRWESPAVGPLSAWPGSWTFQSAITATCASRRIASRAESCRLAGEDPFAVLAHPDR